MDRGKIVEQANVRDLFVNPPDAQTFPRLTMALWACRGARSHG